MTTKKFNQGEFLFKEGEPAEGVLRILNGRVEIMRERRAAAIVLGAVDAGQLLGEMGVLEHRSVRSASARAVTEVEAETITSADFLDEISRSPDGARDLILRLSHRLYEAEDRIVGDEQPSILALERRSNLGEVVNVPGFKLAAATPELRKQMTHDVEVTKVPYLVGRSPLPGEPDPALKVHLQFRDQEPLRLSRDHFAIIVRQGRLYVRDLRSTLGTTVNGRPIGEHFAADEALLIPGKNEIIAGGVASPFVFSITIAAPD